MADFHPQPSVTAARERGEEGGGRKAAGLERSEHARTHARKQAGKQAGIRGCGQRTV